MKKLLLAALLCFGLPCFSVEDILSLSQSPLPKVHFQQGDTFSVNYDLSIKEGWHIWADKLKDNGLIATKLEILDPVNVELLSVEYPAGVAKTLLGTTESLFEGNRKITVKLRVTGSGRCCFSAALKYQGCNDKMCLAPTTKIVNVAFESTGRGEGLKGRLGRYGILAALFFLFLSGLALNLTPCVYPVIPITLSFFAGQTGHSRAKTAALAALYVLGIALTYSILGTFAALSGKIMGALLQNAFVLWGIVGLFALLSLSMFGLYEIKPPSFLMQLGIGHKGYTGAFLMGLIVGIVAAPCVGPVTAGLLIYVAETKDPLIGFLYFFVLSLGLGLPYFLLGLFSGSFKHLPGSGGWLVWVRKFFGFVLLGMAVYYARPLIPARAVDWLFWLLLTVAAAYLGFMEKSAGAKFPRFLIFQRLFAILLLAVSFFLFGDKLLQGRAVAGESSHHTNFSKAVYEQASKDSIPFVVDFRAEWCAPCREFEKVILADSSIKAVLGGVRLFTVDLTDEKDQAANETARIFHIVGVPTIIFFSRGGVENFRETRIMEKWEFARGIKKIKGEKDNE
jgi:thioredoxin:protein disulfide reductase